WYSRQPSFSQPATAAETAGIHVASHAASGPPPVPSLSMRRCCRASSMVTSSSIAVPQLHRLRRGKVAAWASVRTIAALVGEDLPVCRIAGGLIRRVSLCNPRHAGMGPDRRRNSLRALAPIVAGSDAASGVAQFLLAPALHDFVILGVVGAD